MVLQPYGKLSYHLFGRFVQLDTHMSPRRIANVNNAGVQRRLTRKVVQEVDVPRACEKILDPGAPLALRLQASLLYGVSQVFTRQCSYVLNDAEKTQAAMLTLLRATGSDSIDPQAGKTK
jgi:meiotic recombination protein REC8, fungi type